MLVIKLNPEAPAYVGVFYGVIAPKPVYFDLFFDYILVYSLSVVMI